MFSPLEFARVGMVPVHVLRGLEVAGLLVPRRLGRATTAAGTTRASYPASTRSWY